MYWFFDEGFFISLSTVCKLISCYAKRCWWGFGVLAITSELIRRGRFFVNFFFYLLFILLFFLVFFFWITKRIRTIRIFIFFFFFFYFFLNLTERRFFSFWFNNSCKFYLLSWFFTKRIRASRIFSLLFFIIFLSFLSLKIIRFHFNEKLIVFGTIS